MLYVCDVKLFCWCGEWVEKYARSSSYFDAYMRYWKISLDISRINEMSIANADISYED